MSSRKPKLVHLTTTDVSLELLLGPQLSSFASAGYEVLGISASGPWGKALESRGVRHIPLRHATREVRPAEDLRALMELYRLFHRLRPDIVHSHNPKPGIYGRLAARMAGVPVVVNTVHGLYAQPTDPLGRRVAVYGLERVAASCSHAELVQNPEDMEVLERLRVPQSRLHLLGNGIDLGRFAPDNLDGDHRMRVRRDVFGAGPGAVVVGLVGRLVAEKGYREVFAAAHEVVKRHRSVRFVVLGPHEPDKADALTSAELERAVDEIGVRFLGLRHDVEYLYPAMDAYVLASHREGVPRSAMEAAASGLPIVATDIRGCRQVVDCGHTGFLVPVRDVQALADAISSIVADRSLRHRMGQAGRAKALREFNQDRQIETTLKVYERLLRSADRTPPCP